MNRVTKFLMLFVLVVIAGVISAFGDSRDINDKLFATTISVDKKDGEIWFYVEFANIEAGQSGGSSGGSSGSSPKYTLMKAHGSTLTDARMNLDRQLDKPLYISGVRTLLISEDFAKDELLEYLYRLRDDETYRKKVITTTTRDDMEAMFKAFIDQNKSVGNSIENNIQTLDALGDAFSRTTSRLLENLSDTYTGILIPCVGLQDKEIALTGYTVVNDTKAVGFIPIEASKGMNILKADKALSNYLVPYHENLFTYETVVTGRQTKTAYENGHPAFTISLNFDATLLYGDKKTPYGLADADYEAMTSLLEQMIRQDVQDAIFQAQSTFHTDYLQLDDAFRVTYPVLYEQMDWNDAFARAAITPEVKVKLKKSNMLDYSTKESR